MRSGGGAVRLAMKSILKGDAPRVLLATAPATDGERKIAVVIAVLSLLLFAGLLPFVRVPLARLPAFIPSYEAALFFVDLITAIVLFDQFARLRSVSVLCLARGYLFDALMVALWERKQRAIDLWLMLVMWIWLFDIALSAVIGSHRFDLGFYAGRIFGLVAASFLLVTLIIQMARMYAAAMGMVANAEQRFADLARSRSRGDGKSALKGTGAFVQRENIAHCRELLSRTTDDREWAILLKLLAEEEAKASDDGPATKP